MKIKLFTLSLILFSLTSYSQYSQYKFNGNADDGIGNYNGVVTGATISPNRFGLNSAAYSFNSTNKDYIAVNPSPNIFGQAFGISVWFKALPNDSTDMNIVDWYACGYGTCLGSGIYTIALRNDRLFFQMRTVDPSPLFLDTTFSTTNTFDDDAWHHTVFTFDSTSGDIAIYIDNQVFKSFNRPFSNLNSVPTSSLVPMSIGRRDNSRVGQSLDHFNGKIDDISIYNEFLSAAKVDSLFNAVDTSSSLQCPNTYTLSDDTTLTGGDSVTLTLSGSDVGISYYLWDTINNAYAHGPVSGSGNSITFRAPDASSIYHVLTEINVSNSLDFDGINDYVSIDNTSGFPMGNAARTMECWMKTTASGSSHRVMLDYGNKNISNNRSSLQMHPDGELYFAGQNNDLHGTVKINDGIWHHVAVTHDGNTIKLYVDGVSDGLKNTSLATLGNAFKIGVDNQASGEYFDGEITKVRIWNTAYAITAINQLMNSCVSGDEANLVVAYNFAQDSSSTLTDVAISSKNGMLTNMNTINDWKISPPFIVSNNVVVIQTPVGIKQYNDSKISIYPNPSRSFVTVDLGEEYNKVDLAVHNQLGQALIKASYTNISKTTLDLSSLPKGSYVLVVITEKGKTNLNVIKN